MNFKSEKKSRLKKSGGYYVLVGAIILVIAVVHFGMQLTYIQKENLRSVELSEDVNVPQTTETQTALPDKQIIEVKPEVIEVKEIEVKIPEFVKSAPVRQKESIAAPRKIEKKNNQPETRAERLRRAERILTGI